MPPKITTADERLIAAYREAALRLERTLQDANGRNKSAILRRINVILAELSQLSNDYVTRDLVEKFKEGSEEAVKLMLKTDGIEEVDVSFTQIHKEAMQQLADDATLKFANAIEGARREASSLLTRVQKQKILGKLIAAEIEGASNPAARVQEVLEEEGIVSLRTPSRRITIEAYADMLVNTLLGEAHNLGALTRYVSNGLEYVRVIERDTACPICKPMDDKIVWLGDPRLIPIYHPHCRGGIAPFQGEPENPIRSIDDPRIPEKTRTAMLRKG